MVTEKNAFRIKTLKLLENKFIQRKVKVDVSKEKIDVSILKIILFSVDGTIENIFK